MKELIFHNFEEIESKEERPVQFFVDVVFGNIKKNCNNYGICKIERINDFSFQRILNQKSINKGFGLISLSKQESAEIIFLKSSLSKKTNAKFFQKDYFLIEENFKIFYPDKCIYEIRKGAYPIIRTLGTFIINV